MIIVSQPKNNIANFDNITNIELEEYENKGWIIKCYTTDNHYINLAIYKTEERAKEVLQEIINRIMLTERFEATCIPECQNNMVIDMYDNNRPLFIYEMPEE